MGVRRSDADAWRPPKAAVTSSAKLPAAVATSSRKKARKPLLPSSSHSFHFRITGLLKRASPHSPY